MRKNSQYRANAATTITPSDASAISTPDSATIVLPPAGTRIMLLGLGAGKTDRRLNELERG
jgi:hypothetical protein